jgi:transcriptional regulator with XRE-family HTH domain
LLEELMSMPAKIKELRTKHGMTQAELASRLDITRSAVNAWEQGGAIPSTETIVHLARIFKVPSDYLLGIDNKQTLSVDGLTQKEVASVSSIIECFLDDRGKR